jgi:hypothetical protein
VVVVDTVDAVVAVAIFSGTMMVDGIIRGEKGSLRAMTYLLHVMSGMNMCMCRYRGSTVSTLTEQ